MDVIEAAISFEKEGEAYYWELADKTDNRGVKNICLMLARDEEMHIKALARLMENGVAEKTDSTIIKDAKVVFGRFINDIFDTDEPLAEESMYLKAMSLEQKTKDYYSDCAVKAQNTDEKKLFEVLSAVESKHYEVLRNILEFRKDSREWIRTRAFDNLGNKHPG